MNEKRQRGGKAYHSILEPHFDFIREQRQRRRTWQEIADLLFTEKSIRVTLYAPYRFYRRKLKRAAKPHWEDGAEPSVSRPIHPIPSARRPQARPAPLPPPTDFKRPPRFNLDIEDFT